MASTLPLDASLLRPGTRVAVALSGGADSVALLLALRERAGELGLVLSAAHLNHGLRGAESDGDEQFCRALCVRLAIPFVIARVDTAAEAAKAGEGIEEAARRLRYAWFRVLSPEVLPHAVVATAHTRDDQAETVLAKFLRGAWTAGLAGIYPEIESERIVRPLLSTTRVEVEAFLRARNQTWREDSTNQETTFTRNRIRHELLPELEKWNPRLREHLAHMATLARDDEQAWELEIARIAPQLILAGKPVRGGGRSASGDLAIDVTRFATLNAAVQRRLLRHAATQLGFSPDFAATESMRELAVAGRSGQKLELARGLRVERSHRELRLSAATSGAHAPAVSSQAVPVPGKAVSEQFGCSVELSIASASLREGATPPAAQLRVWKAGDRVRLRYSSSARKVKEVLERLHVSGEERRVWPVLEWQGRIVWMRGVEVEPDSELTVRVSDL